MTVRALSAAMLVLTGGLFGVSLCARAEPEAGQHPLRIAQAPPKSDDDKDKGKHKGNQPGKRGPNDGKGDNNAGAKQKAFQDKKLQADKAKQDAFKQKVDAQKAQQEALKQKQLQLQQAKEKALKDKQQANQAKQDAFKKKQLELQQAKEKALKDRQQADQAKQDAFKKKQLELQQAKEKALKDRQQAEQEALKKKQLEQAKDKGPGPASYDRFKKDSESDKARDHTNDAQKGGPGPGGFDRAKKDLDADKAGDRAKDARRIPGPGRYDRAKADSEFEKARERAKEAQKGGGRPGDREKWNDGGARKFLDIRSKRKEKSFAGGSREIISEPDRRVIVRDKDRTFIRYDETARFKRTGRELRRERQKDGAILVVTMGLAGALIYSLEDEHGRLLRRSRKGKDGREFVLIDNRSYYRSHPWPGYGDEGYSNAYVDLPPPVINIPRNKYIVEYEEASPDDIYEALNAPPVDALERGYSLDEVRQSYALLERMRRVDLSSITFDFGSWDVGPDQYQKLSRIADAIRRILDRSPDEVFLIEGHTDAVGSDIDNLSLSDRRAESVAVILSDEFGIPPENLVTQGYGEQYLKEPTEEPSRINRRVGVRRITPLLDRQYSAR